MKNLDESLIAKKTEIEQIKNDVQSIKKSASTLKAAVQEYSAQMQKAHNLNEIRKDKEKDYNTVITFLQKVDEHYLDAMFPLFKESGHQPSSVNPQP